jgi:hypothetical protein
MEDMGLPLLSQRRIITVIVSQQGQRCKGISIEILLIHTISMVTMMVYPAITISTKMNKIIDNFNSIVMYSDTKMTEIWLLVSFWFCSVVLFYNQNLFGQSVVYDTIRDTKEWWWAVLFLVLGIVKCYGIAKDNLKIKKVVCWIGTTIWVYLFLLILRSPVLGLVTVLFTLCTLMQSWVFWRIQFQDKRRKEILNGVH